MKNPTFTETVTLLVISTEMLISPTVPAKHSTCASIGGGTKECKGKNAYDTK